MTIDEAIKVLGIENKNPWNRDNSPLRQAVKLGVEALKELKALRKTTLWGEWKPLPGETKEKARR